MIVVTEHRGGDDFLDLARSLLEALAAAEGFLDRRVGRSPDDPQVWTIVTSWRDVGSMRRGFRIVRRESRRCAGHGQCCGSRVCVRGDAGVDRRRR